MALIEKMTDSGTRAPARSPAAKRRRAIKRRRATETRAGYAFLTPWLLGFVILTAGPMLASLYLSFTNYNLFAAPKWVGLDNFQLLFHDPRFLQSAKVTATYVLLGTPVKLISALAVAMLLNNSHRGKGLYRSSFYAPSLIGASVSIAIVWKAMFILLTVWQFGAPMVIFLAGLKQVPADLYEAASVDGAGSVRKFLSITLPMLSPVLFFNLLLETIHAFQIFASAFIISGGTGGPAGSTLFYTLYLYQRGFVDFRMGYAAAMAWVLVVVVGIITLLFFKTSKFWVHYSGEAK